MATQSEGFDQIRDPGEQDFNQRQRLKEIWDHRQRVNEYAEELALSLGESIGQERAERIYHQALKRYVITLHTLFVDVYADEGKAIWMEEAIGKQVIEPPTELNGSTKPKVRKFVGVKSVVEAPPVQKVTFQSRLRQRHKGYTDISKSKTVTVPWHILDTTLMVCNAFLSDIGLEAKMDDEGADIIYGFDQSGDEPQAELRTGEYPDESPEL